MSLPKAAARLLLDLDGDGFPDALDGRAWIGSADIDAAVEAAAEILGALSARALTLPLETATWPTEVPALYLGTAPPPGAGTRSALAGAPASPFGADDGQAASGLLLTAPDGPALRRAAGVLASDLAAGVGSTSKAASVHPDRPNGAIEDGAGRLSLGTSLSGGGLYLGRPSFPTRFVGGFAAVGSVPAALEVATRLAIQGLEPAVPLTAHPTDARVRAVVDPALGPGRWAIRVVPTDSGIDRLEVAGVNADALAHACRVFARSFPRLPDGRSLEELEPDLERFLRLETRDGRLAAAAVAVPQNDATSYQMPYPRAAASRLLGAPVHNAARAGARTTWRHDVAWEGERLLEATARLTLPDRPYVLEAYASETLDQRRGLASALDDALAARGRPPEAVVVRHATKPALHWLVEEVAPALPPSTAALCISVGRQEPAGGAPERWLRELYPVVELLEQTSATWSAQLELREETGPPSYLAVARDADGAELARYRLSPPVAPSLRPDGTAAPTTTGAVRLLVDGAIVAEQRVPTDREVVWSFLVDEVFPVLKDRAADAPLPFMHEIAVVVHASEPDDRLPLDHELDSVLEGLHEDVYFGILEVLAAVRPDAPPRTLAPGRILPFFHARPGGPTRVEVTLRELGSSVVAAIRASGERVEAAPLTGVSIRATALAGQGPSCNRLELDLDGRDASVALDRLAWAARAELDSIPKGIELTLVAAGRRERLPAVATARGAPAERLPARPLHPGQVADHVRRWAASEPRIHLRTAHESLLGQPLPCIEVGHPSGPNVSRARRAAWKPTVLVSARQHANEATSTPAVLELVRTELVRPRFTGHLNLVVHPLENPDGARLHAALCSLAPTHMHHAARYTAFGADLQVDPRVDGRLAGESAQRHDAWERWRPQLHLNNHGYPAHEWIRFQTGYLPAGFESWSLPVGHLTILTVRDADQAVGQDVLELLRRRVAAALADAPSIARHTRAQCARAARYRDPHATPFRFERGMPFWERVLPPTDGTASPTQPPLVVITEVPDETVSGALWDACVLAHQLVDEAVLAAVTMAIAGTDLDGGAPASARLGAILGPTLGSGAAPSDAAEPRS